MTQVVAIENRRRVTRGWKDEEGKPHYDYEDLGKWAILAPPLNLAFPCDNMDLAVGDEVDVVLRKRPERVADGK